MDTGFVGNPSSDQAIINTTKIEDSWDRDMMTCEKMTQVYKMGETIYILFNIYGRWLVEKLVSAWEKNGWLLKIMSCDNLIHSFLVTLLILRYSFKMLLLLIWSQ